MYLYSYEIADYFKEKYNYRDGEYDFLNAEIKRGSVEEINAYIGKKLSEKTYSEYFAVKIADYLGLAMIFYAIFICVFLFTGDTRRDIYELLHTKPIKSGGYIGGKVLGGMCAIMIPLILMVFVFELCSAYTSISQGFPYLFGMCIKYTAICILPSLFMVIALYTLIAVLLRNPWPAVPLLILYMIYSNMGSQDINGKFTYILRPFSILTRFPERFFEFSGMDGMGMNRILITVAALIIIIAGAAIWARRRI